MKILIISEVFYPLFSGVSITVERLARQLAQKGYQVTVITANNCHAYRKETRDGYVIHRLPAWPNPFRKGFYFTISPGQAVNQIIQETHPDLIHLQDPLALSRLALKKAKRNHIPVVVTHHFTFEGGILAYLPWLKPVHQPLLRLSKHSVIAFYNQCTCIIVPSLTVKALLRSPSLKTPIEVISNGVDVSRFAKPISFSPIKPLLPLPDTGPLFLYVGRLDPEKNLPLLLQAFAGLETEQEVYLLLVGKGNLSQSLKKEAQAFPTSGQIKWLDSVEHTSAVLPALYQRATLFCMPSAVESESIATMEAMSAGLPILAADQAALPELVVDGENGYLLPANNAQAWTQAMQKILADPDRAVQMGKASQKKVASRDLVQVLSQLEKLYQRLSLTD